MWDTYGLSDHASGVFTSSLELYRGLCALGVPPCFVSPSSRDFLWSSPESLPQGKRHSKIAYWFMQGVSASRFADRRSPCRLLHGLSNFNIPTRRTPGVAKVLTVHDLIPLIAGRDVSWSQRLQMKLLMRGAVASADRIVAVSQWTAESIIDYFGVSPDRIVVIPNGFPKYQGRSDKPRPGGPIRALAVARGEKYKRLSMLGQLAAIAEGKVVFSVVTNGVGLQVFREQFGDQIGNGLQVLTGLTGAMLEEQFKQADIFVHPSRFEGFGLPPVSALSYGLPVVYTSGSGIDEFMPAGLSQGLLGSAPVEQWLHAIALLAARWRDDQAPFRQFVSSAPNWASAAKSLADVYRESF